MRFNRLFVFMILIIIFMLLFTGCANNYSNSTIKASNGILDLTKWDMNKQSIIQLNGEWEFYWNKLIEQKDLYKDKPDIIAEVPNTWEKYSVNGKSFLSEGYATYRLHVKTKLSKDVMLGLRINTFSSAYKLFINSKLIASNGKVATNAAEEVGQYRPTAIFFNVPSEDFDIIIQVSNFHYSKGGFWQEISIGSANKVLDLQDFLMGKETFIIGILIILFLFYLIVYLLRKELKYSLYFALMCITLAVTLDMVGQFILLRIFPEISLKYVVFIWYSSTAWTLFFLILFVHELFKTKFSEIIIRLYFTGVVLSQLIYILTPVNFYTRFGELNNIIDIVGVISTVLIVAIGIIKGHKDGWLNIASIIFVAITFIHDVLYRTNKISSSIGELIFLGIFLFIFLQMVIQAQRIKQIDENKTSAELSFLQAQIKPHFLYNTLNTVISISRYDMDKARELLYDFSNYLRRSFDFKDLSQFVSLKNEIELSKAYIEIEKARFEERIGVTFNLPEDIDFKVPKLVLQPIIENAVIHGILPKLGDGKIDISISREGKRIIFSVKDNGVGMNIIKHNLIFKEGSEYGVGLSNIDFRLRKLYGKGLVISSRPDAGTEVTWCFHIK